MIRTSALRAVKPLARLRPFSNWSASTSLNSKSLHVNEEKRSNYLMTSRKFSTGAETPKAQPNPTNIPTTSPQPTSSPPSADPHGSKALSQHPFERKAVNDLAVDVLGEKEKIKLVKYLLAIAPGYIKNVDFYPYTLSIETDAKNLVSLLALLKYHSLFQMKCLIDIQAYDTPGKYFRFTVQYALLSVQYNYRINVRVQTREGFPIATVSDLYNGANWSEREVWDMYGIYFEGHPNFRRILTDYGFKGHPLRKDFPLTGFVELFYDDWNHGVFYEPVELAQEYRNFNFKSPWLEQ